MVRSTLTCDFELLLFRPQIGGHAYGGTYPGPMGSVLTPVLDGLKDSRDLPHACTMNGRCAEVCPVGIPLPTLLRAWRMRSWRERLEPGAVRVGIVRGAHGPGFLHVILVATNAVAAGKDWTPR